ncbi:MAG: GTP 3',8-cyclase MoaA [Nitrospirae bacterium]|nr:GTP 3',8-cyclase MoaA [Nitrospirota bacterium]
MSQLPKSQLVDAFNRKITYMRISVTDRCNLRCVYCVPSCGTISNLPSNELMTFEEMHRLVKVAAKMGLNKIRITGGEPLVRRGVVEFISAVSKIDGIRDIAMTTNGVLLKNYAQSLKKAGLKRLNISLDTFDPKKFLAITKGDCFDRVWEGIIEAERVGFDPIKLNVVPSRGVNDNELVDFAKLTLTKPFQVRFIEFMPVDDWEGWKKSFISKADMMAKIEAALGKLEPVVEGKDTAGPAKNYRLHGAKGMVGFISAISEHFCDTCNRIRLGADGRIKHCLFSESYIDFKEPMRNGCEDSEIERLLVSVMDTKPEAHNIDMNAGSQKYLHSMTSIGG